MKAADHGSDSRARADLLIQRHVLTALAAGAVPSPPLFDIVAVTAIEIHMIARLARAYNVPVPQRHVAAKMLISVLGGIAPAYLSAKSAQLVTGFPIAGRVLYAAGLSVFNGACVYAVGKVFQEHFESGGKFLSRDNSVIRSFFEEKLAEGRAMIPSLQRGKTQPA